MRSVWNNYNRIALILIIVFLSSCKLTKEQRRLQRGSRKIERIVDKFPELSVKDTVKATVNYLKPKTSFQIKYIDRTLIGDTIVWKKGDATLIRWRDADTIHYQVICDTVRITNEVEIPVDRIQPTKYVEVDIVWWKKALMWIGGSCIVLLIIRFVVIPLAKPF